MIGAMFPWGLRPALKERQEEFDLYEYGPDGDDWSEDDEYAYYGATSQNSGSEWIQLPIQIGKLQNEKTLMGQGELWRFIR